MQTLLRDRAAGLMHSMIYFGFLVLFAGTVTLEIDHLLPNNLKFLEGGVYLGYSPILDLASLLFLGGLAWAFVPPLSAEALANSIEDQAGRPWILVTACPDRGHGLATEAARITLAARPVFEMWSVVGYPLSFLVPDGAAGEVHLASWIIHAAAFLAFLGGPPDHEAPAHAHQPANMFLSPNDRPKGAMRAVPEPGRGRGHRHHRRLGRRRLHLEAALRHRRLHDLRTLHIGLSGQHHRQAARSAGDGPESR